MTVGELILHYWELIRGYYVKNNRPTGEVDNRSMGLLTKPRCSMNRAARFGPDRKGDAARSAFSWTSTASSANLRLCDERLATVRAPNM
jgi:hypothetical protein